MKPVKLRVDAQAEVVAALTYAAEARGLTLSQLTHLIFLDWIRRELPPGQVPHYPPPAQP